VCALLLALEQAKKMIQNCEIIIIFKFNVVVGYTFVLVIYGNMAVISLSQCNVVVGNVLVFVLEGKPMVIIFTSNN